MPRIDAPTVVEHHAQRWHERGVVLEAHGQARVVGRYAVYIYSAACGAVVHEHDIARLIVEGVVDRKEGLANSDSPNNLMWRLQNDFTKAQHVAPAQDEEEGASFTEITLDVKH